MPDRLLRFRPAILPSSLTLSLVLGLGLLTAKPGQAADWGYDDMPAASHGNGPVETTKNSAKAPAQAAKHPLAKDNPAKESIQKATTSRDAARDETSLSQPRQPALPAKPSPEELAARQKVSDLKSWMQIYALTASSPNQDDRDQLMSLGTLPADLRKKLEDMTFEKLTKNSPQYCGVTAVWQPLSKKVGDDLDYKESYRLLFRALLRHAVGHMDNSAPEAIAIHEILGPTRIAEMGPPVLTEDAINAYSDMTCFAYAKNHPDHTLEGEDNRQLFANVIRQKYNDAPNESAKKAMCNFDLTWASFRCRYLDANEAEKARLLDSIGPAAGKGKTSDGKSAQGNVTPKMLKIFALGPWGEPVIAKVPTVEAKAEAKAMDLSAPADKEPATKTTPVAAKMNQKSEPTK